MSGFNKMTIKGKEFQYDLDPDIIFNYTSDHVEYMYTKGSTEHEETEQIETIYAANLIPTKDLKIKAVLKCRNQRRLPILVIIAVDMLKNNYIFCYNVTEQQLTQAATKKQLEYKVTQASITQDPLKVAFMGSQMSDSETCYGLVIGTENGTATLILLKIEEPIFEASILSVEPMVSEKEGESLGSVTAIHILHSGDGDTRMGHADPQIALGYSLGSIFIYRFRANVYVSKASRFRPPVDLSEYTEFREFPIKCISCTRSYNSLTMTVSFVQEKPHNVIKYQYSSTYVKIVEIHGNLTHKQRKIINPEEALADVLEAKLLASSLKTEELDNIIQLSILYEGAETFGLNIWHISPKNVHEELNIHLPTHTLVNKLLFRNKLRSDNCIGFYQYTPQKLVQRMLQDYSRPADEQHERAPKRRMDMDQHDTNVKKRGRKKKVSFEDEVPGFERESSTAATSDLTELSEEENLDDPEHVDAKVLDLPTAEQTKDLNEPIIDGTQTRDTSTFVESKETEEPTPNSTEVPDESMPTDNEKPVEVAPLETEELDEATLVEAEELNDSSRSADSKVENDTTAESNEKITDTSEKDREIESEGVESTEKEIISTTVETQQVLTYDSGTQNKEVPFSYMYEDLLASVTNVSELTENEANVLDSIIDMSPQPVESAEIEQHDEEEQPIEDVSNEIEKNEKAAEAVEKDSSSDAEDTSEYVQFHSINRSIKIFRNSYSEEANEEEEPEKIAEETDKVDEIVEKVEEETEAAKNVDPVSTSEVEEDVGEVVGRSEEIEKVDSAAKDGVSTAQSNEILDDYVIVDKKDIPIDENIDLDDSKIKKEENEQKVENETEVIEKDAEIIENEAEVIESIADEEVEDVEEQKEEDEKAEDVVEEEAEDTAMDVDDMLAESAALYESESIDEDDYDEEMADGPDYCDDAFSVGEIDEKSIPDDDECILLSSDGDDVEEKDDVEKEYSIDTLNATDDVDSIMTESLSDVGSLQQSFVPASNNTSVPDTPPTPQQSTHHPAVDYVPVSQQDLLRLLQGATADIPVQNATRESTIDSASGYTPDFDSTENTQTPTSNGEVMKPFENIEAPVFESAPEVISNTDKEESTDFAESATEEFADSVQSLAEDTSNKDTDELASSSDNDEFAECVEMEEDTEEQQQIHAETQRQQEMEQIRLAARTEFSSMLYEIFGDESIDNFINRSHISQEKLDEIGSSCWFNPNPHMKLILLRYCYKHNMGKEVISLCRLLSNTANFTREENLEYKNIYLKYLREYPAYHHGEVVNIFHADGRLELLQREMDYYKPHQPTLDTTENRKQRQSYMKYYGFGLRY